MNKLTILFLLIVFVKTSYGQLSDNYEPYKASDYPRGKFQIKLDTVSFSKFNIEIRQVKTIDYSDQDSNSFYCRGWLTIKNGNKIIAKQYFRSIEGVGGCSGFFIPSKQPRKDYFIFSKFGDYDGSIYIFDTTGKLEEKAGGIFYISMDKRYLFSNYDSDIAGLTVFNLNQRQIVYSESNELLNALGDWYFQDGKYLARAYNDNSEEDDQQIEIAIFDFKTNILKYSKADKTFLKDENKLKVYNDLFYAKDCNCGP